MKDASGATGNVKKSARMSFRQVGEQFGQIGLLKVFPIERLSAKPIARIVDTTAAFPNMAIMVIRHSYRYPKER